MAFPACFYQCLWVQHRRRIARWQYVVAGVAVGTSRDFFKVPELPDLAMIGFPVCFDRHGENAILSRYAAFAVA